MKNIALVMTSNLLHKNKYIDTLIKDNIESINLLIELKFRNPNTSFIKHNITYLNLIGFRGFLYVVFLYYTRAKEKLFKPNEDHQLLTLEEISKKYNLDFEIIDSVNSGKFKKLIFDKEIDYVINSGNQIYNKKTLDSLDAKIINRHTSLLPEYGGIYPVFWQMLNDENYGGVTLHWIDEEIDKGKIAYQQKFNIHRDISLFENYKTAFKISLNLCNELIQDLNNGIEKTKDLKEKGSYYSWPTRSEVKKFKRKKLKIV
tara:strand:+ start:5876 stop:6652 length:777 start_codon:yes stop_codon:yes gene_type:complete